MADKIPQSAQSRTAQRRASLVLSILRGETSIEEAARSSGLTVCDVEAWREEFLAAAEEALRPRLNEEEALGEAGPGDKLGVWICTAGGESLAPCLLMEAACPDRFPLPASARWAGVGRPPKPFERSGEVSLLHGVCSLDARGKTSLFLFSTKMGATAPFERCSALSEWRFPVQVAGIVVLLDKRAQSDPARGFRRALRRPGNRTLEWVTEQQLPFVVAAMGYGEGDFSEGWFRQRYDLRPQVLLAAGPSMARDRRPRAGLSNILRGGQGEIASLLGIGELRFDSDYATRLLAALQPELRGEEKIERS